MGVSRGMVGLGRVEVRLHKRCAGQARQADRERDAAGAASGPAQATSVAGFETPVTETGASAEAYPNNCAYVGVEQDGTLEAYGREEGGDSWSEAAQEKAVVFLTKVLKDAGGCGRLPRWEDKEGRVTTGGQLAIVAAGSAPDFQQLSWYEEERKFNNTQVCSALVEKRGGVARFCHHAGKGCGGFCVDHAKQGTRRRVSRLKTAVVGQEKQSNRHIPNRSDCGATGKFGSCIACEYYAPLEDIMEHVLKGASVYVDGTKIEDMTEARALIEAACTEIDPRTKRPKLWVGEAGDAGSTGMICWHCAWQPEAAE